MKTLEEITYGYQALREVNAAKVGMMSLAVGVLSVLMVADDLIARGPGGTLIHVAPKPLPPDQIKPPIDLDRYRGRSGRILIAAAAASIAFAGVALHTRRRWHGLRPLACS